MTGLHVDNKYIFSISVPQYFYTKKYALVYLKFKNNYFLYFYLLNMESLFHGMIPCFSHTKRSEGKGSRKMLCLLWHVFWNSHAMLPHFIHLETRQKVWSTLKGRRFSFHLLRRGLSNIWEPSETLNAFI